MDLANLNAFIAIAETGSFSGAAERLFLTQPAIRRFPHQLLFCANNHLACEVDPMALQ